MTLPAASCSYQLSEKAPVTAESTTAATKQTLQQSTGTAAVAQASDAVTEDTATFSQAAAAAISNAGTTLSLQQHVLDSAGGDRTVLQKRFPETWR